ALLDLFSLDRKIEAVDPNGSHESREKEKEKKGRDSERDTEPLRAIFALSLSLSLSFSRTRQYSPPFRRDAEKGAPDRRDVTAEETNGHEQPVAFTVLTRRDISTCGLSSAATRDRIYIRRRTIYCRGKPRASCLPSSSSVGLCARNSREARPTHFDRSSAEGSTTTDVQSEQHREKERGETMREASHGYGATVEERKPGAGFSLLFPSYPRSYTAFFFPSS
ncbi:hypothetical protein ALC62_03408, partial [Cyphomyrmex costatus]